MRRLLPALAVAVLALTSCSEVIDDTVNSLAATALDSGIREELEKVGIEIDGSPECETDFARDGSSIAGDADCTAKTTDGESVEATFSGTLSGNGCEGSLVVSVNGESVVDVPSIPDCKVDLNF